MQHHPDRVDQEDLKAQKKAKEKFLRIQKAYENIQKQRKKSAWAEGLRFLYLLTTNTILESNGLLGT